MPTRRLRSIRLIRFANLMYDKLTTIQSYVLLNFPVVNPAFFLLIFHRANTLVWLLRISCPYHAKELLLRTDGTYLHINLLFALIEIIDSLGGRYEKISMENNKKMAYISSNRSILFPSFFFYQTTPLSYMWSIFLVPFFWSMVFWCSLQHFLICLKNIVCMWRYPPGHGDIFPSLMNSGKLDALMSQVCYIPQFVLSFWHEF